MHYGLINQSQDASITQDVMLAIAIAITIQLNRDVSPMCETSPNSNVAVYPDEASVPPNSVKAFIVDEIPEAPGALAYHTVGNDGRPVVRIGWGVIKQAGGTLIDGSVSLSGAISHEVIESDNDPYVDFWCDFDGQQEVACEYADPVEGDFYNIAVQVGSKTLIVAVSNFVTPRWFSSGPGPYDKIGNLSAPLSMSPGGYMVLRVGGPSGTSRQVYGDAMPQWKRAQKEKFGRRAQKKSKAA